MDSLDFAVYRYLSPGGEARFWAGRRVLDPRITPREVAERVGISESAARSRIARLGSAGYLRDRTVVPNPSLFEERVFVADLRVRQPGEVDRILRDIGLVEGVVFTRDVLDEDRRKIEAYFLAKDERAGTAAAMLLGRLVPSDGPVTAKEYHIPRCSRELTALDWRVLQGVWGHPEATLSELAATARISAKTAARCYRELIDSRACWWTHGPRSEEFPLALVLAELRTDRAYDGVLSWVAREAGAWMPVARDGLGIDPEVPVPFFVGLFPADVPAALERFVRKLSKLPGVTGVRRTFALGSATYPAAFAQRLLGMARPAN